MRTAPMRSLPMRAAALLALPAGLAACSDYDLHRPDKEEPSGEEEIEDEVPTPDPDIEVSQLTIDFGGRPKDCPAEPVDLVISNVGEGDLVVSDIRISGAGLSAFGTDWDGAAFTLATDETRTLSVGFTPAAWVDYAVDVEIESNDPDERVVDVAALGFGAGDTMYEQSFVQEFHTDVDVLWVVDNSCSMDEEMQQVATNFASFIDEFVGLGLNYHLAVVTTDMDDPAQSGRFRGPVLTQDTPDVVNAFLAQVDQGSTGSGSERGFDAIQAALTEPLLSTDNAGFLREEAALAVILLSDEDDDSPQNTAAFVGWFESLKSDPGQLTFSAICGDRGFGCQEFDFFGNTLSASAGPQYIDATDLTSGFWASICTSDYTGILQQISLTAAGMTVEFPLDDEPSNLGLVVVTVDGAGVAQDSVDGWTYATATQSLIFNGDGIPGPGAQVTVAYPVASECQ